MKFSWQVSLAVLLGLHGLQPVMGVAQQSGVRDPALVTTESVRQMSADPITLDSERFWLLEAATCSADAEVREAAARALGFACGARHTASWLKPAAQRESPAHCPAAEWAVERLLSLLDDSNRKVADAALWSLDQLGPAATSAAPHLRELIARHRSAPGEEFTTAPFSRTGLARALGSVGTPSDRQSAARELMLAMSRDARLAPGCGTVRSAQSRSLSRYEEDAIPAIMEGLRDPDIASDLCRTIDQMSTATRGQIDSLLPAALHDEATSFSTALILIQRGESDGEELNKARHILEQFAAGGDKRLAWRAASALMSVEEKKQSADR